MQSKVGKRNTPWINCFSALCYHFLNGKFVNSPSGSNSSNFPKNGKSVRQFIRGPRFILSPNFPLFGKEGGGGDLKCGQNQPLFYKINTRKGRFTTPLLVLTNGLFVIFHLFKLGINNIIVWLAVALRLFALWLGGLSKFLCCFGKGLNFRFNDRFIFTFCRCF